MNYRKKGDLLVVHYSSSFAALKKHILRHNSSRKKLSEHIRQSTMATARDIICIYGLFLIKVSNLHDINPEDLPPLRTNNVQLARVGNTSPRTIQRHIKRLLEAGILLGKKWHGTNSSYELFINPQVLFISRRINAKNIQQSLETLLRENHEYDLLINEIEKHTSTCPYTDTGYNGYIKNNVLKAVDKPGPMDENPALDENPQPDAGHISKRSSLPLTECSSGAGYTTGHTAGHTGEKVAQKSEEAGEKERSSGAGEKQDEESVTDTDPARSASLQWYAYLLWTLAKNLLYKDRFLTQRQEMIAQKLLIQWYQPVQTKHLQDVHEIYVERIGLVKKYLDKDPERRYVQLPYRYFDPYNPSGFTATKKWYRIHLKRKLDVQAKLILHNQIRRFILNQQKAPDKQRSPYDLYRECEQRVGKLGDTSLLEQFYAATLNPSAWQQLHASKTPNVS